MESAEWPARIEREDCYPFSYASLSSLGYTMLGETLVPGHTVFPFLQFFREHPGYDRYWLIESDVRFSGA